MEPKDKTALPPVPMYALYYRSESGTGNWYEEGTFNCEWAAKECMIEHIRIHGDMDCVIVRLNVVSEYKGWTE